MNTALISGAGVAGPAAARWLSRQGIAVTVVENSPALRRGGQVVDFRGDDQLAVLDRMGVLDEVRRRRAPGADQPVVDARGRTLAVIPHRLTGGDLEIARGDLVRVLHESTADDCEYLFGDSITSLTETGDGVLATFEQARPRAFDLVIGADGVHSNVRRLVFGPESDHVRHLGRHYALADLGELGEPAAHNEPGRMASITRTGAFFVFTAPVPRHDRRDVARKKQILTEVYRGMSWRVPELLDRLADADEVHLEPVSRVSAERCRRGRVVLLGDAAHANTLGGFGTGLAVVGAYVLAGELVAAGGAHEVALRRYEERVLRRAKATGRGDAGRFLAPRTRAGLRLRDGLLRSPLLLRGMLALAAAPTARLDLPDYDLR